MVVGSNTNWQKRMTNEPSLQAKLELANQEIARLTQYETLFHAIEDAFTEGLIKVHQDQEMGLQPTVEGLLELIKDSFVVAKWL